MSWGKALVAALVVTLVSLCLVPSAASSAGVSSRGGGHDSECTWAWQRDIPQSHKEYRWQAVFKKGKELKGWYVTGSNTWHGPNYGNPVSDPNQWYELPEHKQPDRFDGIPPTGTVPLNVYGGPNGQSAQYRYGVSYDVYYPGPGANNWTTNPNAPSAPEGSSWGDRIERTVQDTPIHQGPVRSVNEPSRGQYPNVPWTKIPGSEECPQDNDWKYQVTCNGVSGTNPNYGDSVDSNVRIKNLITGEVRTFNYHGPDNGSGGAFSYEYADEYGMPADWTYYEVQWVQVHTTNYHWEGSLVCGDEPQKDKVIPEPPVVKDVCGTENDHYGLPDGPAGVAYSRDGLDLIATITTEDTEWGNLPSGWVKADETTARYAFNGDQFTNEPCDEMEVVPVPIQDTLDPCNGPGVTNNVTWTAPLPADTATVDWSESNNGATRTATLVSNNDEWTDGTTAPKVFNLPEDSGQECVKPDDKVTYSEWQDGTWVCGDTTVLQTRTVTTVRYVWDPEVGGYVEQPPVVTTESQVRNLTQQEISTCPLTPGDIASECVGNVPYLSYVVNLPEGFVPDSATPLTITFVNPDGEDYVVNGLPLSGELLWPGASATEPLQWPGWTYDPATGTYTETPDANFGWTRTGVTVMFDVNPHYETVVNYPAATELCANPPSKGECVEFQDEDPNAECYVTREPDVRKKNSERENCKIGGVETTHAVFTTTWSFNEETQKWESTKTATSSLSFEPYTAAELKALGCTKTPPPNTPTTSDTGIGDVTLPAPPTDPGSGSPALWQLVLLGMLTVIGSLFIGNGLRRRGQEA